MDLGSIARGIGQTGSDLGTGALINADEQRAQAQQQLQQFLAKLQQQRTGIEQGRFDIEKQAAARPQYKGFTTFGSKAITLYQNPDGTMGMKSFDLAPGEDQQYTAAAQRLISSIADPVKRQRAGELFAAHMGVGDIKGGFTALQTEIGREESATEADKRIQAQQDAIDRRQQIAQTRANQRQQRAIAAANARQDKALKERERLRTGAELKPEYKAGLNVLHVSLWGDPATKTPGLASSVDVLNSKLSRAKLIAAGVGTNPDPNQWMTTRLAHAGIYNTMTPDERMYVYQLNRAVSAINALRSVTGLPRSTQALMDRYVMELPDPVTTPSASAARNKLKLIEREINAALAKGPAPQPVGDIPGETGEDTGDDTVPGEVVE